MAKMQLGIFDWNGTLLDDMLLSFVCLVETFTRYRVPVPTLSEYRNEIYHGVTRFYQTRGLQHYVNKDHAKEIRKRLYRELCKQSHLRPHTEEVLVKLRSMGIKIALVTGEDHAVLQDTLLRLKIENFFDHIESEVPTNKEPAICNMMNRFNVLSENTFFVEDSPGNIKIGKELGITTIGIMGGHAPDDAVSYASPHFLIDSLTLIPTILETIHASREKD